MFSFVALFLLLCGGGGAFGKPLFGIHLGFKQSAGAEGTVTCEGKPMGGVLVKLYDKDRGVDTDDKMGSTRTDKDGHFRVDGSAYEFGTIDPKFNIYHDCANLLPCQRKISFEIPDKYVSRGEKPEKYYQAGQIELEGKQKGETRDCIH